MRSLPCVLLLLLGARAGAAPPAAAPRVLRVCADPNNLPFSNQRGEGLENQLAELLARELKARVEYTWWAQRRGFFRETLQAGRCDVVLGAPRGLERALTSRPYYRSTYVFVSRAERALKVRSLDDPALRTLKVGVHVIGDDGTNTPAAHALARRGVVDNVVGYSIYGDYARESPPSALVEAVDAGEVDVAIVWGPLAGYFARRSTHPLTLVPVTPAEEPGGIRFVFDISVAVRKGDEALKAELEAALQRRRTEVEALLARFGVPRP